ncbi:MAG: Holliday junction branch migration protein RuvA [Proteobacteria bacterium]|nr:Holliday junction branch migration protein RuvA [Pseudomonadota bacterium]
MLGYLQGIIKERQNGEMILLTGSESTGFVGYQVKTPDHPRYEVFIPGERAELYLYTHVREDAFDLYGFRSASEKNFYTTLLSVSGVGPKLALTLLSHTDEANLIEMILSEDKTGLTDISGVGKKTAERIILELKDTIEKKLAAGIFTRREGAGAAAGGASGAGGPKADGSGTPGRGSPLFIEAYLALQGLGFKEIQAKQMVESAIKKQNGATRVEDLVKIALQGGM